MVETLEELPFIGDQVGLLKPRPGRRARRAWQLARMRAALSLAELYRAADRDADAHAVLASAVEGFPPTQQFPELVEAQTFLAALSH